MPIYEYRCEACGKRSSALLPRFDAPDPACPHCQERRLGRLVSTFATVRGGEDLGDFGSDADGDDSDFGGDYGGGFGGDADDF